jgi:hypothetical protein
MHKSVSIVLVFLIIFIIVALVLILQSRRAVVKKDEVIPISDPTCDTIPLSITNLTVDSYDYGGQIAPTFVYQAKTNFHVETSDDFDNGGVIFALQYPNESGNGVVHGFATSEVTSGHVNSVMGIPCAIGWNVDGGPNSSTCKTEDDVDGWIVYSAAIRQWAAAQNVNYLQTTTSATENKFTVTWDLVENADIYAVSLTLVGDSYDSDNNIIPTTLSFGGLTTKNSIKITTVGSNHFTAGIPEVQSITVYGFHHCDMGTTDQTCLGVEL